MDSEIKKKLNKFEINLITGICDFDDVASDLNQELSSNDYTRDFLSIFNNIVECKYEAILNENYKCLVPLKNCFKETVPLFCFKSENVESNYQEAIDIPNDEHSYIKELTLLMIAVAALQEFVKANMSGPRVPDEQIYSIYSVLSEPIYTNEFILDALSKNGETILTRISHPKLLYLSLILLFGNSFNNCLTHKWWLLRSLMIHQRLIFDAIPDLHETIIALMKLLENSEIIQHCEEPLVEIMFYVECVHAYLHYHKVNNAEEYIKKAQNVLDLNIELSGAVGKRTRFQIKPVAQLKVLAKSGKSYQNYIFPNCSRFPMDLLLQDDTVLNDIEFVNKEDNTTEITTPEEQLVILAYCNLIKKKMAATELKQEEIMAYVSFLLSHPRIWSIQVKSLTMRCQIEKDFTRKFERSLTQLEELINSLDKDEPLFFVRGIALFSVSFPFKYDLEKLFADLLISIGSVKSALEIYERLNLWEETIICYKQLGLTSKAIQMLEMLIAKKPTPILWCYLGDVTDDPDKYNIAWELSNKTNARSQRSIGYYYFKRKEYKSSIPHFILSTEKNTLQPNVWFSLGYAATQCEDFELAARAYRQVVSLDHDNFEAWNNLANAYIRTKQKVPAWKSLQEALKCNYEEWRVWENFLLVSIDVGAFEDVIRSFHRLLDLKGKYVDSEVARILVNAIVKDLPDTYDSPSSRLKDKALQLFGRLTSIITNNPEIWELYSILTCCGTIEFRNDREVLSKSLTFQQKAVRSYIQSSSWEQKIDELKSALNTALRYAELCSANIQLLEDSLQKQQQKNSVKYSLNNIVTKAERASLHFPEEVFPQDLLVSVKTALESIINL